MVGEPDDDVGECVLIHSATVFVVPESVRVREENLVGHGEEPETFLLGEDRVSWSFAAGVRESLGSVLGEVETSGD